MTWKQEPWWAQSLEQITVLQIKITITFKLICFFIFKSHFMICRMIWIWRSSPLKKSNQNGMLQYCCFEFYWQGKWQSQVPSRTRTGRLGKKHVQDSWWWFMNWKVYQLHFFIIYSLQGWFNGAYNDLWLWFVIGQIRDIYEWIFLI